MVVDSVCPICNWIIPEPFKVSFCPSAFVAATLKMAGRLKVKSTLPAILVYPVAPFWACGAYNLTVTPFTGFAAESSTVITHVQLVFCF